MFIYVPRLTAATYCAIIILFFLPFINIKCNHEELDRVKGIELATGCRIGNHSNDSLQQAINAMDSIASSPHLTGTEVNRGNDTNMNIERNNFATASLLLAIGGLVLSFLMQWRREMLQGIIGLAGMMSLFLMRVQFDNKYSHPNKIPDENTNSLIDRNITIEYETGYWLVIICFLLIAAINIYSYMEQMKNGKMEISDGLPSG
ncbi:MAG TPA: hypothetical protein VE978_17620 [Chitinophagales bacterium]|nr:hypothetical protein [Chitinophagales bacterium]